MNEQQKRVIRENPRLSTIKLAKLIKASVRSVERYKSKCRIYDWCYSGVGIPFVYFNKSRVCYTVIYKEYLFFSGNLSRCVKVLDHLLWCIENDMFKQPRIEHPYFENLKLGD